MNCSVSSSFPAPHLEIVFCVVVYLLADALVLRQELLRHTEGSRRVLRGHVRHALRQPRLKVVKVAQEPAGA